MYGRPAGRPLTETRDYAAHTKKGKLRGQMARELLAAHKAGRVQVAIGRASDYFGPRGGAQSNLGDRVFPAVIANSTARVLGDPDQPHTYTYIPDIGEGLAVLGEHPDAPGRSGICQTTRRPGPPVSWSSWPSGRPATRSPGCGRSLPADPNRGSGQSHPARGAGDAVPVRRALHRRQQQDHRATRGAGDARGVGCHRDARQLPSQEHGASVTQRGRPRPPPGLEDGADRSGRRARRRCCDVVRAVDVRAVFEAISLEKDATESWAYWTATDAASGPSCGRRFKSERNGQRDGVLVRGCRFGFTRRAYDAPGLLAICCERGR